MGLCNDGDFEDSMDDHQDYGWVVVVKLELPQLDPDPCMSVYDKVSCILFYILNICVRNVIPFFSGVNFCCLP